MDVGQQYNPRTVEEVFRDFKSRRAGMIKALTTEVEEFYQQCDPEKENLCLYGFPNERWEVNLPAKEVPPELPEPALGINFARDGMEEKDWLSLVAVHSGAWLLAVAFYFGARFGFDKADRKRLFNMINDLPTIYEVVTGAAKKQSKEKTAVSNHSSSKAKPNPKRVTEPQREVPKSLQLKDDDEDEEGLEEEEDEHGDALCGACGENYGQNELWIFCDICEKWFHEKCVKITPARAEHIKQYKCPTFQKSSKKLKGQLTCPSSDKVDLFSDDVAGADIEVSEVVVGGGLRICKDFADKLSMELERLLKLEDVVGPLDVKKLRDDVKGLKKLNEELEENSKNLAHDNTVAADKLFAALTEKSELITECDSLSRQVKDLGIKVQNLEEALKTANGVLVKGEEAWAAERAELMGRMNGLNDQLTKCQAEAMSSEEGYGESVARFAHLEIDVKDHSFDGYLVDLA